MDLPSHLVPTRSVLKPYAIPAHVVDVDPAVTPQMALDPNFWPHLVHKFQPGHEVIVRPRDFSYRLHAEVIAIDPAGHYAVLRPISLTEGMPFTQGAKESDGYRVDHDPVQGWRILRARDLIEAGLPNEEAARARLAELRTGAAKPEAPAKRKAAA